MDHTRPEPQFALAPAPPLGPALQPVPSGRSRGARCLGSFLRITNPLAALMATAIFALHPLQTEAVAYVFARATLLATLFCLLAWRDWLAENHWRADGWFLLGLLAKEGLS